MEPQDQVMGIETEYDIAGRCPDGSAAHTSFTELLIERTFMDGGKTHYDNPMGGRIYIDSLLIEGSTPECAGENAPRDLALYMRAMDETILEKFYSAVENIGPEENIKYHLFKGGTDWKNSWYGIHLNLRIPESISREQLVKNLAPYLATNVIWAGRGGIKPISEGWKKAQNTSLRFVFSTRMESTDILASNWAGERRGLICTKSFLPRLSYDLPGWKRLHLIQGDALFSDFITFVNAGITYLIIRLISKNGFPKTFPSFSEKPTLKEECRILKDIVGINSDTELLQTLHFSNHRPLSALKVQLRYLEILAEAEKILALTPTDKLVLKEFGEILRALQKEPRSLKDRCENWILLSLAEGLMKKYGSSWTKLPKTDIGRAGVTKSLSWRIFELQYNARALDYEWGIWHRLLRLGKVKTLFSPHEVERAKNNPPASRAAFRTDVKFLTQKYGKKIAVRLESWTVISLLGQQHPFPYFLIENPDPTGANNKKFLKLVKKKLKELSDKIAL